MRTLILASTLLLLFAGGALPRERSYPEARGEMLRGLRSSDPDERSQAVYELDGFDSGDAARTLVRTVLARDDRAQVYRAALQLLGAMKSEDAAAALAEESARGKPEARARVLEALGKWRRPEAEPPLLQAAYDEDPRVQIAAVLALEGMPGERADLAVSDALASEHWAVRSAAIHVLRQRRSETGVGPLIERLAEGKETGRLLDDVRDALVRITEQDFGFSHLGWLRWQRDRKGLEPPDEVLAPVPVPEPRAEVAGVRTRAKRVLYLLALNQSMNDEVRAGGPGRIPRDVRDQGGTELEAWTEAKTKLDFARLWIAWSIDRLAPDAAFDIVTYGGSANAVFGEFLPATPGNRERAKRRLRSLSASGNANLYAGLWLAYTLTSKGPTDVQALDGGPEVIFSFSDGTSDTGEIPDGFRAFEEAERWNRFRQIRFHAFGLGTFDGRVLSDLAGMTPGGQLVSLP